VSLVIADTGPINYLVLTGYVNILPDLFGRIALPSAVRDELSDPDAPAIVRHWIASPVTWLELQRLRGPPRVTGLGAGETEAITLALELGANLLLMDDRRGVKAARSEGIEVTGTLAVLGRAGRKGLVDLSEAFTRLKRTNFRYPREVMDLFLRNELGHS
jgi:predicted nucleic acid-binding protein